MMRVSLVLLLSIGLTFLTVANAAPNHARELTFQQRVEAQRAIERVYYSHFEGATRPFEEAVTDTILENKVRSYLRQSAALEKLWHHPVTGAALAAELSRVSRSTRMPDRLSELYAALDNDPWLIQECLLRPILVSSLVRTFASTDLGIQEGQWRVADSTGDRAAVWEDWWRRHEEEFDHLRVDAVADEGTRLPRPEGALNPGGTCAGDDLWRNGILDDGPDPQAGPAVWTGSLMLVWGPSSVNPSQPAGLRYDPITDIWSPISVTNAPSSRGRHSAIWTGSEMIVWGGTSDGSNLLATGGRYDPVTDHWAPLPSVGAPSARYDHAAVWTGSVMVVWGGYGGSGLTATGGRFDPASNQWSSMSTAGAPAAFFRATGIWSGSRVVIWGGQLLSGFPVLPYGGRYDPVGDVWTPVSTVNEPSIRAQHTAVWSGDRMLVWGGLGPGSPPYLNDGGRYDPVNDVWVPMSTFGAPSPREDHSAVWTGSRMIVWGGWQDHNLRTGGSYDPGLDQWAAIPDSTAPSARSQHLAVWTGSLMVVWGGNGDDPGLLNTGGKYDPAIGEWTPINDTGMPRGPDNRTAVWTGTEMILWGLSNTSARYDPVLDTWAPVSSLNAPVGKRGHTAVWTGQVMAVWGGTYCPVPAFNCTEVPMNFGGRYNPLTDHWDSITTSGAPVARKDHSAVWTGSEMIVWGGGNPTPLYNGGRYDPVQDLWIPMSPSPLFGSSNSPAVWTGQLMLVWGQDRGLRYNPSLDSWSTISFVPLGITVPDQGWTTVWTGERMIIWGGQKGSQAINTGALYDPISNGWSFMTTLNLPTARYGHTAVWNGSVMIVWGGSTGSSYVGGGGSYDPVRNEWRPVSSAGAPGPRAGHKTVWDGEGMIVTGGVCCAPGSFKFYWNNGGRYILSQDADHDGFRACAGDCNDASGAVHPGAVEQCNGLDDDCSGVVDDNPLDQDGDGIKVCFDCRDDLPGVWAVPHEVTGIQATGQTPTSFTWDSLAAQAGSATRYEFISGGFSIASGMDFSSPVCLASTGTPDFTDARTAPGIGTGYWYLGRAANTCGVGTFGTPARDALSVGPCP